MTSDNTGQTCSNCGQHSAPVANGSTGVARMPAFCPHCGQKFEELAQRGGRAVAPVPPPPMAPPPAPSSPAVAPAPHHGGGGHAPPKTVFGMSMQDMLAAQNQDEAPSSGAVPEVRAGSQTMAYGAGTTAADILGDLAVPQSEGTSPDDDFDLPTAVSEATDTAASMELDNAANSAPSQLASFKDEDTGAMRIEIQRAAEDLAHLSDDDLGLELPEAHESAADDDLPTAVPSQGSASLPAPPAMAAPIGIPDSLDDAGSQPLTSLPDFDAPIGSSGPSSDDLDDLDLPTPATDLDLGSPAVDDLDLPTPSSPGGPSDDLDLPTLAASDLDLPTPAASDLDLPAPADLSAPSSSLSDLHLPQPDDELDLPIPSLEADLPTPNPDAYLPKSSLDTDLPIASAGADLPISSLESDLPVPSETADLPQSSLDLDLPQSSLELDLPSPSSGDLPTASLDLNLPDSDLNSSTGDDAGDYDPLGLDIPEPTSSMDLAPPSTALSSPAAPPPPPPPPPAPGTAQAESRTGVLPDAGLGDLQLEDLGGGELELEPELEPEPASSTPDSEVEMAASEEDEFPDIGDLDLDIGGGPAKAAPADEGEFGEDPALELDLTGIAKPGGGSESRASASQTAASQPAPSASQAKPKTGPRASPTPKAAPRKKLPRPVWVAIGAGLTACLAAGGLWFAGVFDSGPDTPTRATREAPNAKEIEKRVAASKAGTRDATVLDQFDLGTPKALEQAAELAGSKNDTVGQAEALAFLAQSYGPAAELSAEATQKLQPFESNTLPHVQRVFALIALTRGDFPTAQGILKGLADDPKTAELAQADPLFALYRSWLALAQGDPESGLAHAQRALELRPASIAAQHAALDANVDLQRVELAGLEAMGRVVAETRDQPYYALHLRWVERLREAGLWVRAENALNSLDLPEALPAGFRARKAVLSARIALDRGDTANASRILEALTENEGPSPELVIAMARVALDARDFVNARRDLGILLQRNPDHLQARELLAKIELAMGEGKKAAEHIEMLEKVAPDAAEMMLVRGRLQALRLQVEQASRTLDSVRSRWPEIAEASEIEADMWVRAGKAKKALSVLESHLDRLAAMDTNNPKARIAQAALARQRARVLTKLGDNEGATEAARQALKVHPGDNEARLVLAEQLERRGDRFASETILLDLQERTGGMPGLTIPLARAYLNRGETKRLEKLIGPHLEDHDSAPREDILISGALLRISQSRFDDALQLADRVLDHKPDSWQGHVIRARVLLNAGRYQDALSAVERANAPVPEAEVHLWHGKILEYNRQPKLALAQYEKANDIDPSLLEAAALRGRLLAYRGSSREAISVLKPVLKMTEEFPYAFLAMGRAHADMGDKDEAISHFRKAYHLDPNQFSAFYEEGRIYSDRNQHDAAVKVLEKATQVAKHADRLSSVLDTYRRLGRAYTFLRRNKHAKAAYREYLEIAPASDPGRREVQRDLRKL